MRGFWRSWSWVTLALIVIFLIGLGVAWWSDSLSATKDDIWSNISKAGVAIAFTTVAGAIATGGFKLVDERRARDQERRRIFRDVLEAYNQVKSIRRHIRALGLTKKELRPLDGDEAKELRTILLDLNNTQLRFEAILRECKQSDLFNSKDSLIKELASVESFLNKSRVEKWEAHGGEMWAGVDPTVLREFDFPAFVDGSKNNVSQPLDRITGILQDELFGRSRQDKRRPAKSTS